MRNLISSVGVALLAALSLFAPTASAQDGPSAAVVPFEGRRARPLQRAVERAIDERVSLIDSDEAERAAEDAGAEGTDRAGVAEMAEALGAELIVQGRGSGSRRSPRLELVVRAADGEELARGDTRFRRGRRGRRRFTSDVRGVIDEAVDALAARIPPEPEPEPEPAPSMYPEEPEAPVDAAAPTDGLAILSATIGLTARNRDATISLVPDGTRNYGSGAYPEIALAVEARPFANDTHLGRGLFIQGSFGHSLGLGSSITGGACAADPAPPDCNVSTNFLRFAVGAGWLAPLGDVVELGAGLTVGYDGYHLSTNSILPTAEYVYIRPGARGRIRLVQEALVLDLELAYRGVVGVGAIAESFGEQSDAHGVDVGVGVGGNLFPVMDLGFTWAVRFDWVGYFLSFAGPASDAPASSGEESSVRFTFLVGWSFR